MHDLAPTGSSIGRPVAPVFAVTETVRGGESLRGYLPRRRRLGHPSPPAEALPRPMEVPAARL